MAVHPGHVDIHQDQVRAGIAHGGIDTLPAARVGALLGLAWREAETRAADLGLICSAVLERIARALEPYDILFLEDVMPPVYPDEIKLLAPAVDRWVIATMPTAHARWIGGAGAQAPGAFEGGHSPKRRRALWGRGTIVAIRLRKNFPKNFPKNF